VPALVVTCAASRARVAANQGRPAGAQPSAVISALRRAPVGLFADGPCRADVMKVLTPLASHSPL